MPTGPRPAPPTGSARVAISGTIFTLPFTNVFWLNLVSSTPVVADLNSIIDSVLASYNTRFGALMSVDVGGTITAVASWTTAPGIGIETVRTHALVPTGTATVPDAAACHVVNWTIASRYRGGHPRTYFPGVQSGHVTNGHLLDSAVLANWATAAAGYLADLNALTHGAITSTTLGTVSFASHNAWRVPPIFDAYLGAGVRSILGTQRRRLGGR
jgi:hypothetical protein